MQPLSSAQKSFLIAKQLSASKRLDDWIAFLAPVAAYDREGDRTRARLRTWGIVCIVVGVFGCMFVVPAVLIIPGIYMLIKRARMAKEDLPASLNTFVMPMLTLMREEVPGRSEVALELDLRGYEKNNKQIPYRGPSSGNVQCYRDPWAAGAFPLADGNRVEWKATDVVRVSKRTKRSASGKLKSKRKLKLVRLYSVALQAQSSNYQVSQNAAAGSAPGNRCKVREGEKRNQIRLTSKQPPHLSWVDPTYEDLVSTIKNAYGMLSQRSERSPA